MQVNWKNGSGAQTAPYRRIAQEEWRYNVRMISKDLLEILVCPACRQNLALKETGDGLKCIGCHRVYPVRDDIPILLVDESVIEAA